MSAITWQSRRLRMPEVVRDEYIQIGAWVFATPACACTDLASVWSAPQVRGDDRPVPGVAGVAARARVRGAIDMVLPVVVFGERDQAGEPHSNVRVGLSLNIQAMFDAILPPTGADPTRTFEHHLPGGAVRQGPCVVSSVDGPNPVGPSAVRFGVGVRIPAGVLTVVSP